ncbi:EF-hand domain-containing protein [Polaromonas sp.]|uniref:EF-hand domain-containing protein n=1 Tax=Polaromonas sp. TaxID=1869339 RepID=UPI0032660579
MTPTPYFIPNFEVRSVLLLAALTVGTALVTQAQTASPDTPPVRAIPVAQEVEAAFQRADVNKDGRLSRQEAARFPVIEQHFDQIDTNHDQMLSPEEFQAALKT